MKRIAAMIHGNGTVEAVEQDVPELKENSVLVKIHASLISPGTEMNGVRLRREKPVKDGDYVFGYSSAGEIVEVKGDCKGLKVGQRVGCLTGGHVSLAVVPVNLAVPIPDDMTYEQATFLSLAATALQSVHRTEPMLGEYGVIAGLGIVGNMASQLFRISGARVLAWESLANRIAIAKKCGIADVVNIKEADAEASTKAFAAPYGLDFALVAFGGNAQKAFDSIHKCMKVSADTHEMGRITLVGGCSIEFRGGAASGNLDVRASSRTGAGYHDTAWEFGKDYPAVFVQFTSQRNAREIVRLISEKRLLVDPVITNRIPLERVGDAAELLITHPDREMGIILTQDK